MSATSPPEHDSTRPRSVRRRYLTGGLVLVLLAAAGVYGVRAASPDGIRVTAYFDRTVGMYEGSDLRILGVRVGRVAEVRPQGTKVKVVLAIDHGVQVPANARAVAVAPSVVADRYIQLTPAYTKGPRLRDGAELPLSRNRTPVEIDQLYDSLTDLSKALGPEGANADGALSDLLGTGAKNLEGNGAAIGESIEQFGKAARTLDGSSDELFTTLSQLQSFTTMLKEQDGSVRTAQENLDNVTTYLADDRDDLAAALSELGTALGRVKTFLQDNRGELKKNVDRLVPLTQTLVDQRASLAEALDTAPLAAGNLVKAYDPKSRTLTGRANLNEVAEGSPVLPLPAVGGDGR